MDLGPLPACTALLLALASVPARAAEPAAEGSATVALGEAEAEASEPAAPRADRPWIRRWAPEAGQVEVGLYGGVLLTSRRIELFEADLSLTDQGYKPFAPVAPDFGLRAGYYPARFLGVEGEAGAMPTQTTTDDATLLWTTRASVVGQLGRWSVTPFVLAGAGLLGVASDRSSVGDDVDAAGHVGVGVKAYLGRFTALRLDVRDVIAARRGYDAGVVHSPEILLGLSITLGREREPTPAAPPADSDGDGILDPDDACKDQAGAPDFDGCPIPDSDSDGILDPDDACKDQAGVPDFDGCPIPDSDGDGILDPDDACKDEPETLNGFEDADGCPDELPEELERFTGVIEGIVFATGKATIRPRSEAVLGKALDVMSKYESVRVEISGHTDDRGPAQQNLDLSQRRADAVKQWLVDRGISPERITTRGAGPHEPIADNGSKRGRAKNRRIEFELRTR